MNNKVVPDYLISQLRDFKRSLEEMKKDFKKDMRLLQNGCDLKEKRIRDVELKIELALERIKSLSKEAESLVNETKENKRSLSKLALYIAGAGGGTAVITNKLLSILF